MDKQTVIFRDLGIMDYQSAWDYQEGLLQENLRIKAALRAMESSKGSKEYVDLSNSESSFIDDPSTSNLQPPTSNLQPPTSNLQPSTSHYFLLCEHPPVYTLGKSGDKSNVLLSDEELVQHQISFFHTNRGGDITFHGLEQIVGYPILDLEKYYTDIGKYLRNLEEMVILTLAEYGIRGDRSKGETGVWIDPELPGKERKICAIGVRCSRWITMHGFALNVNTDLGYFDHIIPCGIQNKQVTSIQKELGHAVDLEEAKSRIRKNFEIVFGSVLV